MHGNLLFTVFLIYGRGIHIYTIYCTAYFTIVQVIEIFRFAAFSSGFKLAKCCARIRIRRKLVRFYICNKDNAICYVIIVYTIWHAFTRYSYLFYNAKYLYNQPSNNLPKIYSLIVWFPDATLLVWPWGNPALSPPGTHTNKRWEWSQTLFPLLIF